MHQAARRNRRDGQRVIIQALGRILGLGEDRTASHGASDLTVSGCLSVWGWAHSTVWMQSLLVRVGVRRCLGWLNAVIAEGPVGTIALRSLLSQGQVKRHGSSALGSVGMHSSLSNLVLNSAACLALGAARGEGGPCGG